MREDLWRLFYLSAAALTIGLLFDQIELSLFITAGGYIIWQHSNLRLLLRWLQKHKSNEPPDVSGVYDAICREIDFMRDRHRKRKKKLAGYLKQFQDATTAVPDAAVVLGPYGDIQWANSAAEEFLGVKWPQDYRQRISNLVRHPELLSFLQRDDRNAHSVEIPSPVKPEIQLSISVVPMGLDQHLLLARDVTRMYRLNQIRSDFVANVSHELKTPVTVIKGYLEAMNTDPEHCPPDWRPILAELEAQAIRMGNVIDELLLLSRLEQEDHPPAQNVIDVPMLIEQIQKDTRFVIAQKNHHVISDVDRDLLLLGSKSELHSAFSNLVVNAVRYTPANGEIRLRWYRDAEGAHFEVTDTGIGIPANHIPRLTERFYRVDLSRSRDSGGTGLGLAIVKHVLKRHQAQLHITSDIGKGSTFRCDFPGSSIIDATETVGEFEVSTHR